MKYRYFTCDVFTDKRFRGNQLAVLPHADGLSDGEMQTIAREFNFSESAFVFPPENGHTRKVRIFTPTTEVPFAGHPNIGTAFVLAETGELDGEDLPESICFEEKAGQMYGMGLIGGFCHLYIGQEAVVVGIQSALIEGDSVITSYRDHGQKTRQESGVAGSRRHARCR